MKGRLASIDIARTNQMLEASLAHGTYMLPPRADSIRTWRELKARPVQIRISPRSTMLESMRDDIDSC